MRTQKQLRVNLNISFMNFIQIGPYIKNFTAFFSFITLIRYLSTADTDSFIRPFVHSVRLLAMATPIGKLLQRMLENAPAEASYDCARSSAVYILNSMPLNERGLLGGLLAINN